MSKELPKELTMSKEELDQRMHEQSLLLIKPDGVAKGHVGEIITRLENRGFKLIALKVIHATAAQLRQHYSALLSLPVYPHIATYMTSGPMVAIIAQGPGVVKACHQMAGATDPVNSAPGTIRGDFGEIQASGALHNVIHTSDSPESAQEEMKLWFPERFN